MRLGIGKIIEIQQRSEFSRQALIQLNEIPRPSAGQYFAAHRLIDQERPVGVTLFPGGYNRNAMPLDQLTTAPGIPERWQPGDTLRLRGPLGKGFNLPPDVFRLALCAFGEHSDHLLPLANEVLSSKGEVALFTDGDFSNLPARIEVNQLEDLGDACQWADILACAVPLELAENSLNHLASLDPIRCQTQVLIYGQFPCYGLAECAVCALRAPKGKIKLPCQDGPVFDWKQLSESI